MRILKINGKIADIDEKTAIGIDLQAYDFKEPGQLKVNVSNTFSIPATAHNRLLLGNAGSPSRVNSVVYEKISVDYQVRNTLYITNGAARITSIKGGRINLYVAQRPGFIDEMKAMDLTSFIKNWFDNSFANPNFSTFSGFLSSYRDGSNGVIMPAMIGNHADLPDSDDRVVEYIGYFDGTTVKNEITLSIQNDNEGYVSIGGHFCVYVEQLLKHIEQYFGVDLSSSLNASYNIFKDNVMKALFIPARNITIFTGANEYRLAWINVGGFYRFMPHTDLKPYDGLTVYDFFITTLRLLGCGVELMDSGKFELVRLDNINSIATKSDLLPGLPESDFHTNMEYTPAADGYGQQNIIKMAPAKDMNEYTGARFIQSNNYNTEPKKDLFTVDAFVPMLYSQGGQFVPDMRNEETYAKITYMRSTGNLLPFTVNGRYRVTTEGDFAFYPRWVNTSRLEGKYVLSDPNLTWEISLYTPEVYTVASEYNFLDGVVNSPESYKIKRWVTASQLEGFRKIAPYYVPELGRWVFVNKIKGFNPEKSKAPVEFELIKLPWVRMPQLPQKPIEVTDAWILESGFWDDGGIWKDSEFWIDNI